MDTSDDHLHLLVFAFVVNVAVPMPIGGVASEDGVENLIQLPSNNVRDYTVENPVKARHGRRREQSSVQEDDREFDRRQGHTVVEGVCEEELNLWQIN